MRRSVVGLVVAVVVLCAVGAVAAETAAHPHHNDEPEFEQGGTAAVGLDQPTVGSSDREIELTTTLNRTPERIGEITVTSSVRIPDPVTELTLRIPAEATAVETDGFSETTDGDYEWDTRTDDPSVTFRVPADRRVDSDGPLAEEGSLLFTETDEWALVATPSVGASWRYTGSGEMTFDRTTEIDGPGVAGDRMAFLGGYDEHSHTAHDQRFRLIVPHAADIDESPETIFESLGHASDRLRVGERDEEVFIIAAPTDGVEWAVSGLQGGESDMWIGDDERVDTPTNVWVHEYVHARQNYETTDETEWFTEASATYYAALLTLEEGRISFEEFQRYLADGENEPQSGAVLSDPDSWANNADYRKGALVSGEIDRRIRDATGSESSFDSVFRSLNSHDGELTAAEFEGYVGTAADDDVASEAKRYTTTADTPAMWDSSEHEATFGLSPARFRFALADDDPLVVSGPDGSTVVSPENLTITAGQTVSVTITVTNVGGTVGDYELPFGVGNESTTETGRLDPEASASHEFNYTFDDAGSYTIAAGDDRIELTVEETPEPTDEPVEDDSDSTDTPVDTEPTDVPVDVDVPGFGLSAAVAAILVGLLAVGRIGGRS